MTDPSAYQARQATADDTRLLCPYAGVRFQSGDALHICRNCGTVHLAESWIENGGCTTYGCRHAPDFRKDTGRPSQSQSSGFQVQMSDIAVSDATGYPRHGANLSYSEPSSPSHSARAMVNDGGPLPTRRSAGSVSEHFALGAFVLGLTGAAAPSYLASSLGLFVGIAALVVNSGRRGDNAFRLAAIGTSASLLGFIMSSIFDGG